MKSGAAVLVFLLLAVLATGCGGRYVSPHPSHEIHITPEGKTEQPPGPAAAYGYPQPVLPKPMPQSEIQGERPDDEFVWVPGYHRWVSGGWEWLNGGWWRPVDPYMNWIPGDWAPQPNGTLWWRGGYWRR